MISTNSQSDWAVTGAKKLAQSVRESWRPPKKLTLSEWSDKHAFMSAESAAVEQDWTSLPYQVGLMDAMTDPAIEMVVVQKSARVGYTKCLNNLVGYHMHQDPCPIMVVQPTVEDAEGYSKEEIAPMLRDTKVLKGLVTETSSKAANNTILSKSFPGGVLSVVGANSPRGFRRVSRRVVLFDEVDGYPLSAGAEGDQIKLGIKRTEYYWNRKIVAGSTPTVKGTSKIERLYADTDQRRYFVPCPHCGEFQFLRWSGIQWPENEPAKAYYVCEHNGCVIQHSEKFGMIEKGEWRATATSKRPGLVGFHIWAAYSYSPNATWGQLASEFVESKNDRELLKTFVNTALGETWEDQQGEQSSWQTLLARCEPYRPLTVPLGGLVLTSGVDVQHNRLAVKVKAWGPNEESWLVYYTELFGDVLQPAVWSELDQLLNTDFEHASGNTLRVTATAIDSGDGTTTQAVYAYCWDRREKNIIAIKGASTPGLPVRGKPSDVEVDHRGRKIRGAKVWFVGTDTAKAQIYARLRITEGPGKMHFYIGAEPEYFMQLTAEKQVTKLVKGFAKKEWVKTRPRNEALDCEVYALAAAHHAGVHRLDAKAWSRLTARLSDVVLPQMVPATTSDAPEEQDLQPAVSPKPQLERRPTRGRENFAVGWLRR